MKKLLIIIIVFISFQTWTKADDIKDFKIEGMSIGDSLLDFYDKEKITKLKKIDYPNSDKFYGIWVYSSSDKYDTYGFTLKKNDNKFRIYQLKGSVDMKFDKCMNIKSDVKKEIQQILLNSTEDNYKSNYQNNFGESYSEVTDLIVENGSIRIWCESFDKNFDKTKNWVEAFNVDASSEEYLNWIDNEAYN
jgi:hypothetical protein